MAATDSAPSAGFSEKTRDNMTIEDDGGSPTQSQKPPQTAHEFPEGGLTAWLVVLGCFCISFTSFGYVNSFGAYETYYLQTFLSNYSASDVAWIGSIQNFAQFASTLFSGPLTDRVGARIIIIPCSFLLVISMMLTSLCTEFYQFVLCQGILAGITAGCLFAPAMSIIGHYFFKKRAMAMALASSGSPIGGIIFPILLTNCFNNPRLGFGWGQRILGFISLVMLSIAMMTIRPAALRRKGSFVLLEAFRKPVYVLEIAALFMVMLGIFTPYFYVTSYGLAHGVGPELAPYLLSLINAGSFIGRIVAGPFAQSVGQFNIVLVSSFGSVILLFCWLAIDNAGGLIAFSILFGATSGIIIALMTSTLAHCADHPSQIGTYIGMAMFVLAFGALSGAPITGALITDADGYSRGIIFSAAVMTAGAVLFTWARIAYDRSKLVV